ncbi:hypothetical protein [Paenirhodobacter populi]|uniref:hypothetical protein n=1 Tax=Paenirhodobacter populi TaxID=2306993 RepID=UPI0013E2878A|nr:hypothetical protein [Sinirhodobacter populi]
MAVILAFLALSIASAACGIAAAFILFGTGWALVVASAFMAVFAAIIRTGMTHG